MPHHFSTLLSVQTITVNTAASARPQNPLLCSEVCRLSLLWILANTSKNRNETRINQCWYNDYVIKTNLSSIKREVWTASAEHHYSPMISQQEEWSVIGLPVCAHLRVSAHTIVRECVFVAECVIEGMPHLSSACAGFPGSPFDV